MNFPFLAKGVLGLGAVSTVAIGGFYLYKNSETLINIDDFALEKSRIWTSETSHKKATTAASNTSVQIVLKLSTKQSKNKFWSCTIKGELKTSESSKTLNVEDQLNDLKEKIGIVDNETRKQDGNKDVQFQHFFKNCLRHRETTPTSNSTNSSSAIDLGELKLVGDEYKFEDAEFQKLYAANFLSKPFREKIGIPEDCGIDASGGCTLDKEKLEKIKFLGKDTTGTTTDSATAALKIKNTEDTDKFKHGLKFIFETSSDITIGKNETPKKTVTIKQGTNAEFKLNNQYQLENAWSKEELASKVGLKSTGTENEFIFEDNAEINVFLSNEDYVTGAKLNSSNKNKILLIEEHANHNQGFKFTVKETGDIPLDLSKAHKQKSTEGISKLTKTGKSYSIEHKEIGDKKNWFLVEKTSG